MILQYPKNHSKGLESTTLEASPLLPNDTSEMSSPRDGPSDRANFEELHEGYQQLILCFIAYIKMKLDNGIMVYKDW